MSRIRHATEDWVKKRYDIINTAQGSLIPLSDSAEASIPSMKIFGKTKQFTTTGKNKLVYPYQEGSISSRWGVAITVNDDGSVLLNGTSTASQVTNFYLHFHTKLTLPAGSYTIGGVTSSNCYMVAYDPTIEQYRTTQNQETISLNLTEESQISILIQWSANAVINNVLVKPFIVEADKYDGNWEPYTGGIPSPNPSYPQALESVGKSKNKIPYPYTNTTKVSNGITFTDNGDGSVSVNGTATNDARFDVWTSETGLPAGSYVLRGGISSYAYISLLTYNGSSLNIPSSIGTSVKFTITNEQSARGISLRLMVKAGTTINGIFYPVIHSSNDNVLWNSPVNCILQHINGKNIISYPYRFTTQYPNGIINGCTVTENKDKSITVTGTPNQTAYVPVCDFLFNPGTYVMNGCPPGGSATTYNMYAYPNGSYTFDSGNGVTFTVKEKGITTIFLNINLIGEEVNLTFKPMICLTDANNYDYEPPLTTQSLIIPTPNGLPGVPVSTGGNYTDENGQQYVSDYKDYERKVYVQRVGEYRNTGEAMSMASCVLSPDGKRIYWNTIINDACYFSPVLSSHFRQSPYGVETQDYTVKFQYNNYIYFSVPIGATEYGTTYTTYKEAVSAWLKKTFSEENPLIVLYELETPIETPLSEEEITAYKTLHTNYPNTTIYNDEGAYTEVKYVADPKLYIDNKFAELQANILNSIG